MNKYQDGKLKLQLVDGLLESTEVVCGRENGRWQRVPKARSTMKERGTVRSSANTRSGDLESVARGTCTCRVHIRPRQRH